jgi:MFS family permease
MMSTMDGSMLYVAAVFYALGICYFWPNMIGFIAETMPQTGALGLSIMGGIGMFSSSMFQPIIGAWIQENKVVAVSQGLVGDAADLAAGQATLSNMLLFPAILIVAFLALYLYMKKQKPLSAAV